VKSISGWGQGQGYHVLVRQGGALYAAPPSLSITGSSTDWHTVSAGPFLPSDFALINGPSWDDGQWDSGANPDFSPAGEPLCFGFMAGNAHSGVYSQLYDNWSLSVEYNPAISAPDLPENYDPLDPPPEASRYEFVVGVQPSLEWTPLEVGFKAALKIPLLDPFEYSYSVPYPDTPVAPPLKPWQRSFHTNSSLLGRVLDAIAPLEQNLVGVEGVVGVQGGVDVAAGITLSDGESDASVGAEASVGVQAYAGVTVTGPVTKIPTVSDLLPDKLELAVPIVGPPPYEIGSTSVPMGEDFDYWEFRELVGTEQDGAFTETVSGIDIDFDDSNEEIFAGVKATALVYAESKVTMDVDAYFRRVGNDGFAGPAFGVPARGALRPLDMSQTYLTSTTGAVTFGIDGSFAMTTGSPVWIGSLVDIQEPGDALLFNATFDPFTSSEGLVSVHIDGDLVGMIEEPWVGHDTETYVFALPETLYPGTHEVAFRMDPLGEGEARVNLNGLSLLSVPEPTGLFPLCLFLALTFGFQSRRRLT
jgi:hypothetical protein